MRKFIKIHLLVITLGFSFVSCKQSSHAQNSQNKTHSRNLTQEFKDYWYQGNAEISTYELSENKYGELRNGKATLIYVTEDFVPKKQVKADKQDSKNDPVLKLNSVKKFITGIYPYSIMQSSFLPLQEEKHATKITTSVQEWCGQTYVQLNNRKKFEIDTFSYFESQGDKNISLEKTFTENEIWNLIRLKGLDGLPTGKIDLIPSFEYIRSSHQDIKAYKATISNSIENGIVNYSITYPELKRILTISFQEKSPFIIESWSDQTNNKQPSTAKRIATKKLPYWNLKSKKDEAIRNELGL